MQNLRPSSRLFEKIRYLQNLLPGIGVQGTDSGRKKSKLVKLGYKEGGTTHANYRS